jgi:hypothetical protein
MRTFVFLQYNADFHMTLIKEVKLMRKNTLLPIIVGLLMITLVVGNLSSFIIFNNPAVVYAMGPSPSTNPNDNHRDRDRDRDRDRRHASVPEPSTLLLLGAGLAGVVLLRKKFKN